MQTKRFTPLAAMLVLLTLVMAACGGSSVSSPGKAGAICTGKVPAGPTNLTAWFNGGLDDLDALKAVIDSFNGSQSAVHIKEVTIPAASFGDQVKAAAASGTLPDILYLDGPTMYNYAWNKSLRSLDSCIAPDVKADLLPSIINQGTYNGKLFGVGSLDSGLAMFSRKSVLKANGIRIPTGPSDAWTASEFTQAMKTLQAHGFAKPLDLKVNYGKGEWYTYGYSPIVQSAGGDLINRANYQSADGSLNSSGTVAALTTFQSWFKNGMVDRNEDDNAFKSGRSVFSWVGFWEFNAYQKVYGDDLVLVPLPNFGAGSKTGMGSWQWGITTKASNLDAAWSFVNYTIQVGPELALTKSDGAIPSRKSAIALSPQFAQGGAERLYIDQLLSTTAVPRPQTPAYPAITAAYAQAVQDIIDGKDVKESLDTAVKSINRDIQDNQGYPNN